MPPKGSSQSLDPDGASVQRYRIGYAFPPKKEQSFIQPSFVHHASRNGIDLVPISATDSTNPLTQQGPFHCIIHKLYGHHWNKQLKDYSSSYPHTLILDPPDSIERLHNRVSMLDVVNALKPQLAPKFTFKISVPQQLVVEQHPPHPQPDLSLLGFPVIAKPLLANGSAKSHEMCLVFDLKGLHNLLTSSTCTLPILLQQFVNHGGVIFKVYVVGEYVHCVKRRSLPDFSKEQLSRFEGVVLPFSQISNSAQDEQQLALAHDPHEMPPSDFVEEVAKGIRLGLKLNFFNFDMIRESAEPHSYFVIDINYFPGFAKLPDYERILTDFLLALLENRKDQLQLAAADAKEEDESDHK